jgi:FMN-dependent NADH-azoreductase
MRLLHIDSSALGGHSVSRELTAAVADKLAREHPGLRIDYRDLAVEPLPHWTPNTGEDAAAALRDSEILSEFLAADIVVVGAPMYNFSIPSQLKAWIDRIAVAGKTFRYGENGPQGLAGGKRLVIASSRGGVYSAGAAAAMDFQEAYLRTLFGFLGITDIEVLRAEGVNMSPAHRQSALQDAHAAIAGPGRLAA